MYVFTYSSNTKFFEKKGVCNMKQVTKEDFELLKKAGLLRDQNSQHDNNAQRNYVVSNKNKKSRHKTYFVMEDRKILNFLGLQASKK